MTPPTMTVNGIACDPSNCLIATPSGTFSGSVFAGDTVLDITYLYQSITPPGAGGSLVVTASVDAPSVMALQFDLGGVDLNGSANGSAESVGGKVVATLNLQIGHSGKTAGDLLAQWLIPPPVTCPAPLLGIPPNCRQPPCTDCSPPPPQVCTPPLVGTPPDCHAPVCTVDCTPPGPPPEVVNVPTLGEWSLLALAVVLCIAGIVGAYRRSRHG